MLLISFRPPQSRKQGLSFGHFRIDESEKMDCLINFINENIKSREVIFGCEV
jgi:hypothetical protein